MSSSSSFSNPSQLLALVHWKLVAIIVSTYILVITLWWSISSSDNSSNNDDVNKHPMTSNFDELMAILRNEKQNQNHHKNHHLFKTATKTTQQRGVAIHQFAKEIWRDWYYSGDKSSSLVLLPSSFLHHSLDTLILLNLKEEATEVFETILPSHHHRRRLQQQQQQQNTNNNKTESMQHTPNYLFTTSKNSQRKMMMMKTSDVSVKFVGGLIGAYSLTREERLLDRAIYYYTSIIKNSFEGESAEEEHQHGIPKRFLEPIAGFESPSYDENHQNQNQDKHQREENHDDEIDDYNNNKMPISEILSSFFPVDFLLASSSSSGITKRQRFIRWLTNDVKILRKNVVADRQQENENENDDDEKRNMHLHHYLDENFLNVIANDGQDDFLEMLATSGILPCFIDSSTTSPSKNTKRFSGSVSLTNKFGRYQIESHLKHWILESRMLVMKNNEQHHQDISSHLYEDAIDGMFKFLARYTSTSSSSKKTYFANLGEISVSDFVVLSSSSSSSSTFEHNHETCRIPGILSLGLSFGVHHHNRRRMQQRQHLMNNNNNKSNSYYSSSPGTESSASSSSRYSWNETDVEKFASDLLTSCVNDISLSLSMMNNDDKNKNNNFLNNNNKALLGRTFGTIESLFYFHRYTRDHGLRELAWVLFEEVIVPWSRQRQQTRKRNRVNSQNMDIDLEEEVLMSQTLKFLFLTFSGENVVGYDEFVFDFNGHPFRIPKK